MMMVALSADRVGTWQDGEIVRHPVAAATTIYLDSIVCLNADGYAVPASDTAGLTFAGMAVEQSDNSDGVSGAIGVRVRKRGIHELNIDGPALVPSDVFSPVYVVDDDSVSLSTGTNSIKVGIIAKWCGTEPAFIDIEAAFASSTPGPTGPAGPTGADGVPGATGPQGPAGTPEIILDANCLTTDSVGDVVYATGDRVGGKYQVSKVDIDNADIRKAIAYGIITAKATTTDCTVQAGGVIDGTFSGFTPGRRLFVQTDATLSESPPGYPGAGTRVVQEFAYIPAADVMIVAPKIVMKIRA